jgi:hypothetical protein
MENRSDKYGENKDFRVMTLWGLLTFFPLSVALGVALGSACEGGVYFWPSLVVGFIIGAICVWFIRALGRFMFKFIGERLNKF